MLLPRFFASIAAAILALAAGGVGAQNYPTKPIRIVTSGIGSGTDTAFRLAEPALAEALQQRLVLDNRSSGTIPGEIAMRANPDGYTLLVYNNTLWTESLIQKTPYDVLRDFVPVTLISRSPNVLVVTLSLPVNSVADLVALAKSKPGALNYASGSTGASNHVAAEMFKAMAGVDMLRVPYKNGTLQAADLIAGRVQLMFASISMVPHIKSGKLRAVAVTSPKPSDLFPGLPTVASTGLKDYESGSIYAVFAPLHTPPAIVRKLSNEAGRVLKSPELKQRYLTAGMESVGSSPEELSATIKSDLARVSKIAHLLKPQQ